MTCCLLPCNLLDHQQAFVCLPMCRPPAGWSSENTSQDSTLASCLCSCSISPNIFVWSCLLVQAAAGSSNQEESISAMLPVCRKARDCSARFTQLMQSIQDGCCLPFASCPLTMQCMSPQCSIWLWLPGQSKRTQEDVKGNKIFLVGNRQLYPSITCIATATKG